MKNEITFRGKMKDMDMWVYGDLIRESDDLYIGEYFHDSSGNHMYLKSLIIPDSLGQFIGRIDKYNNKIFTNQRCKLCINDLFDIYEIGTVEFLNDRYILRFDNDLYIEFMFIKSENIEIIYETEEGVEN